MIDKSKRKANVQRNGSVVAIRMTGGPDCLWLNMYLDTEQWQMTCDSDIGFYAYNWRHGMNNAESFLEFCCKWLNKEDWLLRKCVNESHGELDFDVEQTCENLREEYREFHGEHCDMEAFEDVIETACGYEGEAAWSTALHVAAEERGVELPDEYWCAFVSHYTHWQKRFAEICREVIVPELVQFIGKCNQNIKE